MKPATLAASSFCTVQVRRVRRALIAGAAGVLLVVSAGQAQVLNQVPSNAQLVVKVNNLRGVSDKIAAMAKDWGIDQMQPAFQDPLGMLKQQMKIAKGLNEAGDMAFVVLNFPKDDAKDPTFLMLVPVSDYATFLSNYKGSKTDGAVTTLQFTDDPSPSYAAEWGKYAAVTNVRDVLNNKPDGLKPTGLTAKQLESRDIVFYGNMASLRSSLLPEIQSHREQWIAEVDKNLDEKPETKKYIPVTKAIVNKLIDCAESFLSDCDGAAFSLNFSNTGIGTTLLADFKPGSSWATSIAKIKGSSDPLVHGLPGAQYLVFAGWVQNADLVTQIFNTDVKPFIAQLNDLGEEGKTMVNYIDALYTQLRSITGGSAGMMAPANPAQGSLMQAVGVTRGDAKQILESTKKAFETQQAFMLAVNPNSPTHQSIVPNAKTVDGVQFDEMKSDIPTDPNNADAAQVDEVVKFIYGPNGIQSFMGVVNDKTTLTVMGLDDATISKAIAAAKDDNAALAKAAHVASVQKELPASRFMAVYIPLDNIARSAAAVANARMGMQMNLQLPPNLPPIGLTGATDGDAIRFDTFTPSVLIKNLISAGMQAAGGGGAQGQPADQPENAGGM